MLRFIVELLYKEVGLFLMSAYTKKNFVLFVVFIIFGAVIAMQFRSTIYSKSQKEANSLNTEELLSQIAAEQNEIESLRTSIDENLILKEQYIRAFAESLDDESITEDRKEIMLKACLTDVKGPGITIKLDDAPARKDDTPLNWLIIHDQDIKIILNDLKKAGAQAISINGERVVPMSEQICAGPTILINGNRYAVPYVINAIGNPDILYDTITKSERIAEMVEYDIRVEINKSKELVIPKFIGAATLSRYISGLEAVLK
jgi:uncharacterized protein YlxW (UPF0749 family)